MDEFDVLLKNNIEKLQKLFPNQINAQKQNELKELFKKNEENWDLNYNRFSDKKLIRFLLICEAPPISGDYFYSNTQNRLFKQVWNTFFNNSSKNVNAFNAYRCLANVGFLLIDSLPFSMKYTSIHRKKPAYDSLITKCLPWWINKLNNNYTFDPDLKIAFGFRLNALSILKATNCSLGLNGRKYQICHNQIAADKNHRWQPSTTELKDKFGLSTTMNLICP